MTNDLMTQVVMVNLSDAELVQATRQGDKAAFGQLIAPHLPMVHTIIRRMMPDRFFEEDLIQEAVLRAYLSLDSLRDPHRFRPWLASITRHVCLMDLRLRQVQSLSLELLVDAGQEPVSRDDTEAIVERLALRRLIRSSVARLSPAQREVVALFYFEHFDLKEVAELVGISVGSVKVRLHRARRQLQSLLAAEIRGGERMRVPVTIVDVVLREVKLTETHSRRHYQLVLVDEAHQRGLIIWVGEFEGISIAMKLNGMTMNRPLTQVFIGHLLSASGAQVERITIDELRDEVYYATVHLMIGEQARQVDARPSDAIGLAVYNDLPIFISEQVLDQQSFAIPHGVRPNQQGIAEIFEDMAATNQADNEDLVRIRQKSEYEKLFDREFEAQIVLSKAFAPGN